ncbi:SEC10/PgrA surface exclusion domain-containing protein [Ligilactobacillus murinus]|uniref:SEC10/PgrA surface exclusion domain-containing protein n=1 Tax=Ligilactobacillus murinus TaxID=1622 RepID=UPI002E1560C4
MRAKIGKLPENKYKHSERDAKIMVDPIHLSYEQLRDLNIWIVDILNQAQAQLGFDTKFVLTRESINYAKVIADNSTSAGFAHSQSAIDKGAEYVHGADTQGESIATGPTVTANKQMVHDMFAIPMDYLDATTKDTVSLDELKEIIYTMMTAMIFYDGGNTGGWGHATHLTNDLNNKLAQRNPEHREVYFGFAIDGNGTLHFESFIPEDKTFVDQGGFIVSPNNTEALNQAKAELTSAKQAQSKAQTAHDKAQADLQQAKTKAGQTAQNLAQKQQAAEQALQALNASFVALTASNDNLKTAQANLTAATKAVADLNADAKDKQARLDQAKSNLAKAQANLAQKKVALDAAKQASAKANQALVAAQAQVTVADKDATDAQAKLKDLQAKMVAYKFVDTDLADAKNQLADAKAWLAQVTKAYVALYDANKEAQDALDFKDQTLTTAKAKYDQVLAHEAAQKALEQVQKQQATNQNNKKVVTPTATDKSTAQAQTTSTSKTNATLVNTSVQTKTTNTKATQVANLPQTGAKAENWLAVLGAMLVGTLGMFGMAKRKRQN